MRFVICGMCGAVAGGWAPRYSPCSKDATCALSPNPTSCLLPAICYLLLATRPATSY
jgi:hypothetical protein